MASSISSLGGNSFSKKFIVRLPRITWSIGNVLVESEVLLVITLPEIVESELNVNTNAV